MSLSRTLIIKTSQASVLLPVLAGAASYKKLPPPFRVLFYFFVASIGFEIQASILKIRYHNNMPGLHLFTLVEFLTFSVVYHQHFQRHGPLRLFIGINAVVFLITCLLDAFFLHGIWEANTLSRSYSAISMICYALIYFFFMFEKEVPEYSTLHPVFWISTGALVYFGANTLYFMLTTYLIHHAAITATYSLFFHAVVNIVANGLYAQSFRCFKRQKAAL